MKKAGATELVVLLLVLIVGILAVVFLFKGITGGVTGPVTCDCTARCEAAEVPFDVHASKTDATSERAAQACMAALMGECHSTQVERVFTDCRPA